MKPKVVLVDNDTLWLVSQTGRESDFFETTLTLDINDWEDLKKDVESALFFRSTENMRRSVLVSSKRKVKP